MGRPRLILLVRHGESEGNKDKRVNQVVANHKVLLTERGHQQASDAGVRLNELLRPDDRVMFYTLPYLRARQTCKGLVAGIEGKIPYEVREDARMREQDFGNFQGTPEAMRTIWEERAFYGHFFYRIPDGELAADVYDRVSGFNETLHRQFASENFPSVLVLVTHGIWCRVFLMKWFRWTYERFESLRNIPHCKFLVMEGCRLESPEAMQRCLLAGLDDTPGAADAGNGERQSRSLYYRLVTRLSTWDDLTYEELDKEVQNDRALRGEINFNSKGRLTPAQVDEVLRAEKEARLVLRQQDEERDHEREKDRELQHRWEAAKARFQH